MSQEMGANNIKRKTDLLAKLNTLSFTGDVAQFRTTANATVKAIYDGRVTIEDVMMFTIMNAIPTELTALRIVQAGKMDAEDKTRDDVFEFIDTTSTTLEIAGPNWSSRAPTAPLRVPRVAGSCLRARRRKPGQPSSSL